MNQIVFTATFGVSLALILSSCSNSPHAASQLADHDDLVMNCNYNGDNFEIEYFGSRYSGTADDSYSGASVSCGTNVSVLYDGDDMIVFDGNQRSFFSEFADDANNYAVVAAGTNVAGVYDGDTFIVYNALKNDFASEFADDNVNLVKIAAGEDVVMLYDGDDIVAYDARRQRFASEFADDLVSKAVVGAGRGGAIAYDGDNLFGYCVYQGTWTSEFADDDQVALTSINEETGQPQIRVGSKLFELNPLSCDIESH